MATVLILFSDPHAASEAIGPCESTGHMTLLAPVGVPVGTTEFGLALVESPDPLPLVRELRGQRPGLPVVVLTTPLTPDAEAALNQERVTAIVYRPFAEQTLARVLVDAMRGAGGVPHAIEEAGPVH